MSRLIGLCILATLFGCTSLGQNLPTDSAGFTSSTSTVSAKRGVEHWTGTKIIPLEKDASGNFYVTGILNNVLPVRFHLDTGASLVSISFGTWRRLVDSGGAGETEYWSLKKGKFTQVASGELIRTFHVLIDSLNIGPVKQENVRVSVREKGDSNLLGLSFLNQLGEYTIDVEKSVLVVRPSATYRPIPRLSYFPVDDQKSMQAMQHWETAAETEATGIVERLKNNKTPLYLVIDDSIRTKDVGIESPFLRAYRDFLTKYLLSRGRVILSDRRAAEINDALEIRSKVNVTRHEATLEELLITTTVVQGGQILYSDSNVYFLNPPDRKNYQQQKVPKFLNVVDCANRASCS